MTAASNWNNYTLQWGQYYCGLGVSKSNRYSRVRFHIFYCNSAGLSEVFRFKEVFIIAGFHCIKYFLLWEKKESKKHTKLSLLLNSKRAAQSVKKK